MKRAALFLTCAALSGCVTYSEIDTPPQEVNFTDANARDNVARKNNTEIRTFITDPNGNGKKQIELKGAACVVSGYGYALRVVTPTKVALPTYLGATDPVDVECKTDQHTTKKTVNAINSTKEALSSNSQSNSLLGILLETAIKTTANVTRDPSKDKFRFPHRIEIDMTPGEK